MMSQIITNNYNAYVTQHNKVSIYYKTKSKIYPTAC